MQVALYARVSTSQQEKTETIESQLAALQTYVAMHDHTVLPEHIFLRQRGQWRSFRPSCLRPSAGPSSFGRI